jgi:hypothetical protein
VADIGESALFQRRDGRRLWGRFSAFRQAARFLQGM